MQDFIWFTDEKVFTVATPKNPQNDLVYAPAARRRKDVTTERFLRTPPTFSNGVVLQLMHHADNEFQLSTTLY